MIPRSTEYLIDIIKVNINRNGHWNRLHTHAGASWSGVYYIKSLKGSLLRNYRYRSLLDYQIFIEKIVHIRIYAIFLLYGKQMYLELTCRSKLHFLRRKILLNFEFEGAL